jgi:hypothetical protein
MITEGNRREKKPRTPQYKKSTKLDVEREQKVIGSLSSSLRRDSE